MKEQEEIVEEKNQSSDHRYLQSLEFSPELKKTWLNFFVVNFRVVILMIILLTAWGIYSYFQLPRESNPEVKIPVAVVATVYPGASPSDVEELVTKKIETKISGIKGVKKIESTSANSISTIQVEFEADEDLDDSIRKLKDEVDGIKSELPEDADEPFVNEISLDDTPILKLAITGPVDGFTLRSYAEEIQDELEKVEGVREVNVSGGDEREFEVAYDPIKLGLYDITADQANQKIAASNVAVPAGTFEGEKYNYPVRTDGRFFDAQVLGDLPIGHNNDGGLILLRDVADVEEKAIEKTAYSRLSIDGQQPENSVTIDVIKKTGGSIIEAVDEAKKITEEKVSGFSGGIKYDVTFDQAKQIGEDFDQLSHDFVLTLALVFAVLFLIVGLKEALVAGLAIPLVFFVTFGIMLATGISLNFLSVFSLLLSLGLLVDDAIVVVSATKQYLKTGKFTPEEAVLLVLNDFKVVLTTTTLTTVWAFLPLLFATGIIGSYIRSIPVTVSVTLISSLFIALMINHPLAAVLERIRLTKALFWFYGIAILAGAVSLVVFVGGKFALGGSFILIILFARLAFWYWKGGAINLIKNKRLADMEWQDDELIKKKLKLQGAHEEDDFTGRLIHGIVHFDKVIPVYEKFLRKTLATTKRRVAIIGFTGLAFVGAFLLPIFGLLPTEFFPAADGDSIFVDVEAPIGLKLDETNDIVTEVENRLLKYGEIDNFSTLVGGGNALMGNGSSSSNISSITLTLVDKKDRDIKSYELAKIIRDDLSDIQGAKISVDAPSGGPPGGAAFEARIIGQDLQRLDEIANDLKPILDSIDGVVNSEVSLKEAPADYTFSLDQARMEFYGLNSAGVGGALRMAISGIETTKIIKDNDEIKVIARFNEDGIPNLDAIQNIQVKNLSGQSVFLKDVANIKLEPSVSSIKRIDQERVVLLSAGVEGKTRPNAVLAEFQKKFTQQYQLPDGYSIIYGGENEQNTESVVSIIMAMIVAVVLIFSTLIVQFNSFKQSMIVLVTLPLALIGVFVGMTLMRVNLTFPGLIGILALFGIVVKNAIILVDKINLNLKSGIAFNESIVDACKSRLEAIFITSICTIFGIIPITFSNETWTALGAAIIFGLSLSSFLTLFIVPILFKTFIKEKARY